jgi:hypothetical protein
MTVLPNAKEGDGEKERRKGLGWKLERAFVRDDGFCLDWTTVPALIALDEDPPGPASGPAPEGIPLCLTYSRTSEEPGVQRLLVQRTTLEEMGYDTAHLEDDVEVVDLVTCGSLELAPISASASAPTAAAARSGPATATNGRSRRTGKASAPSASAASTPGPVRVKAEPVPISIPSPPPATSAPVPASSPLTIRIKPDPDRPPSTNANTNTYYRSTASTTGKGNAHFTALFLFSTSLFHV